jgi:hypothetical protein
LASTNAIAATSRAILGLLEDAYPREELGRLSFRLVHPAAFGEGGAALTDAFTLCLWRVGINGNPRARAPRLLPSGLRTRPSLPVDLYYLVTPWADDVEKQQRMLGWAMRLLEDMTLLPAAELNRHLDQREVFRPEEGVELICDPLPLPDWISLWDKLRPRLQVSASYLARAVLLDSDLELGEFPRVQERELQAGRLAGP